MKVPLNNMPFLFFIFFFILNKDQMKVSIHMNRALIFWQSCGLSPIRINVFEDIRKSIGNNQL